MAAKRSVWVVFGGLVASVWILGSSVVFMKPGTVCAQVTAQSDTAKRLVGTWRLVSITESNSQQYRGDQPIGLIYYDDKGNMAVQIMPSRPRSKFSGALALRTRRATRSWVTPHTLEPIRSMRISVPSPTTARATSIQGAWAISSGVMNFFPTTGFFSRLLRAKPVSHGNVSGKYSVTANLLLHLTC